MVAPAPRGIGRRSQLGHTCVVCPPRQPWPGSWKRLRRLWSAGKAPTPTRKRHTRWRTRARKVDWLSPRGIPVRFPQSGFASRYAELRSAAPRWATLPRRNGVLERRHPGSGPRDDLSMHLAPDVDYRSTRCNSARPQLCSPAQGSARPNPMDRSGISYKVP